MPDGVGFSKDPTFPLYPIGKRVIRISNGKEQPGVVVAHLRRANLYRVKIDGSRSLGLAYQHELKAEGD
jgi:hypothetical protein